MKGRRFFGKKVWAIALSLLLAMGALGGCTKNNDNVDSAGTDNAPENVKYVAKNADAYVWGAPDTVSVMRDKNVVEQCTFWGKGWLENSDKLECEGIKGDTEAVQVMITAKKDVSSFYLTADDLKCEHGSEIIDKSNVEILAERYIEVKTSSSASITANEFCGWYPDALVPIGAYKASRENKISEGNNQGIWVNVSIPEDAVAGRYTGTLKLELNGAKLDLPWSVTVYDVTMPKDIHIKTAFDIWYGEISNGEEDTDENGELIDWGASYYDFLASRRISPQTTEYMRMVYPTQSTISKLVGEIVEIARNDKVSAYRMPYAGTRRDDVGLVVDRDTMTVLLKEMIEKNKELVDKGEDIDLFEKAYFYFNSLIDEPSAADFDAVRYCDRTVVEVKNELAYLLDGYPKLKNSLLHIPHVVTTKVDYLGWDEEKGGVQTWCVQTEHYTADDLKNIKARKQSTEKYDIGEDFWVYMTVESNNPFSSLQLDDNLLSSRSLFWMSSYYGFSGVLYWCACYYSKYTPDKVKRDVWNDPKSYMNYNGDGFILYPGSRYGQTTPLSTLRLESLRQGTEDYEYIYLLERALEEYNAAHSTNYDFDLIMTRFYKDVFKMGSMTSKTNIKNFSSARSSLLVLLDAVANDRANAGALLSEYESYYEVS